MRNNTSDLKRIDPGCPGLYECHLLYSFGKEKFLRYIVVLQTAKNFRQAYDMALVQLNIETHNVTRSPVKIADNLINLITDPAAYLTT